MIKFKQLFVLIFSVIFFDSINSIEDQSQSSDQEARKVKILEKRLFENPQNIDSNLFVLFYNSNRISKKMEMFLDQSVEELSKFGVEAAKIQLDAQEDEKLLQDLNIQNLPAIKFFKQNKTYDYLGAKHSDGFISWIKRIYQKESYRSIALNSLDEFDKFYNKTQVFVTFFGQEDSEEFKIYKELTENYKYTIFTHSFSPEVVITIEPTLENFLIVYNSFEDLNKTFDEEWTYSNLKRFVKKYSTKTMTRFNMKILQELEENKENVLLLAVNGVQSFKAEMEFKKCRDYFVGKMTLGVIDLIKEGGMPLVNRYQLMPNQLPWLGILQNDVDTRQQRKFQLNEKDVEKPIEITYENIIKFYEDWNNKKLKPYWISERVPTYNDGPVRKVVAKTWDKYVMDETKDVVLLAWDTGCEPCYKVREMFETLGETLTYVDHIRLYDFNIMQNEIEGLIPETIPSIYFFKANDKRPVVMKSHKSLKETIEFLKENGSYEWPRKSEI